MQGDIIVPPPHSYVQGGHMRIPRIFSGKGYFWQFVSGRFSRENSEKGVFLNQFPEIWGIVSEASWEIKKNGYDLYIHVSRAPEKVGKALIIFYISVVGSPTVMIKYIHTYFPSPKKRKEKKWNRGHHNVPEIEGQVGTIP